MESTKSNRQKTCEIFKSYFSAMLFAFTGGNVTLPLLQQQLDDKYHLMDKDRVLENFALGQALPGILSMNGGILIGREICGWPGGIAAALGQAVPAFVGMLFIAVSYDFLSALTFITGAIAGIRAASVAIIFCNALLIIGKSRNWLDWLLVAFAFLGIFLFGLNIVLVIVLCGLAGVLYYKVTEGKKA